ncbi:MULTISPECIES: hypothetical protein [Cytobacillus]|uniref:hypothetical protein n=1 Tax=Cytobacillus TaxID=2675230 RepID=UPI0020412740|nr:MULTISPECIES: hypothetical protein [Cytobacillus]MCM3394855.1 hypothetical protein [Cytobacillus oceanisediminis]UQX56066.1 hypothetical protein M5V91_10795 [Cytobacillus pseudoceanisediminis]
MKVLRNENKAYVLLDDESLLEISEEISNKDLLKMQENRLLVINGDSRGITKDDIEFEESKFTTL